jgi:D-Tyr-tRNAtyr deacylase
MKIVLQRVSRGFVEINENIAGSIDKGYVALIGFGDGDSREKVEKLVDKIQNLRICADEDTLWEICDIQGSVDIETSTPYN